MLFYLAAHARHGAEHFRAHVLRRVERRHREVALLEPDVVTEIAALVVGVGVGRKFHRIELEAGVVGLRDVFDVVEDEELGLRPEEDGVAHAHGLDQTFRLPGDRARVAVVGLARQRFERVADQDHRRLGVERIDAGAFRIGHELHVGLVDRLPAGDRGAVEHDALAERILLDRRDISRDVLPLAARVGETEIDVFHVVVLDHLQSVFGGRH